MTEGREGSPLPDPEGGHDIPDPEKRTRSIPDRVRRIIRIA